MLSSNLVSPFFNLTFFTRSPNSERHLTTCSERVKNVHLKDRISNSRKSLDKLDSFGIKYTSEQKLVKILAIFDFKSICVQQETFNDKQQPG